MYYSLFEVQLKGSSIIYCNLWNTFKKDNFKINKFLSNLKISSRIFLNRDISIQGLFYLQGNVHNYSETWFFEKFSQVSIDLQFSEIQNQKISIGNSQKDIVKEFWKLPILSVSFQFNFFLRLLFIPYFHPWYFLEKNAWRKNK